MIATLSSQFSDVSRSEPLAVYADAVPPLPVSSANFLRATRVGQTVGCIVDAHNSGSEDRYLLVRPFFRTPISEFLGFGLASTIKRQDIVGGPSPVGTCLSEMLAEVWRFLVPAEGARSYSFFVPSDGMILYYAAWVTDMAGEPIPAGTSVTARLWSSVGAPHALAVSSEEHGQ